MMALESSGFRHPRRVPCCCCARPVASQPSSRPSLSVGLVRRGCCVSRITARWRRWRGPTHISRRRGGVRLIRPVVVAMLPSCSKQVLPAPGELHVLGHRPPTDNLANPAQRVIRARWEAAKPGQGDSACSPLELGGNLLGGGGRGGAHGCNGDREGRGRHGRRRNGLRNTCVRYRGRGE